MLGIFFAILSAIFKGFEKVLHRYILVKEDSLSYAFVWHITSSIFLLPIFLIEFKFPEQHFAWFLIIISSVLWATVAYTGFKAYSLLDVSIKTPIGKSKILFVLLLSVIFLKETLTLEKVLGTTLIFCGIIFLTYKKGKQFGNLRDQGVQLTLLSSFLMSIVLLIDKYATNFFNPGMYSFLVFFLPAIIIFPFIIKRKTELKSILTNRFKATVLTVLLGTTYYYLLLRAFKFEEVSVVIPIIEMSTLIAVFGGIKYLKEGTEIAKKIIAAIIIILGAILLSGVIIL